MLPTLPAHHAVHQPEQDVASSSSSSLTLALTPANLRALKRQRTTIKDEAAAAPLHPPPTPEVVILRLIELPKLLVVRIVHLLEFRELALLDTSCSSFHPMAPETEGLTQLSAEMRAQWALKPRPKTMGWSRWLVDVRWHERMVRARGARLACGGGGAHFRHTLVVNKKGVVASCGYSTNNRPDDSPFLGHGEVKRQRTPKVIETPKAKKVVQVAAGAYHSVVLTENGDVFSFGAGHYGQLGHGDQKDLCLPKLVEALKGKKVVQVSARNTHSLVVTESGDVFSFGAGDFGRLGHGWQSCATQGLGGFGRMDRGTSELQQHLPKLVEALKGKKVVQVSAGGEHILVLTGSGDVFSFGNTSQGGHGPYTKGSWSEYVPKLVEALKGKKVVQVSAGSKHSVVLTEGGDVFSFGWGYSGQLGHGDKENQDLPKLVEALKGKKVVQVSAGVVHSLVLTKSGDVFSFGFGAGGQLGHGDRKTLCLPKLVEALKGKKVVEVQAGPEQSVVLTKDERILVSGLHFRKRNPEWDRNLAVQQVEYDVPMYLDQVQDLAFGLQLALPERAADDGK